MCATIHTTAVGFQCYYRVLSSRICQVLVVQGKLKDKQAPPPARRAQGLTSLPASTPRGRTQDKCVFLKVLSDAVVKPCRIGLAVLWVRTTVPLHLEGELE